MHKRVQRWTSKVDLFSKRYIIVPINESLHWYLAIIYNPSALFDGSVCAENAPAETAVAKSAAPAVLQVDSDDEDESSRAGEPNSGFGDGSGRQRPARYVGVEVQDPAVVGIALGNGNDEAGSTGGKFFGTSEFANAEELDRIPSQSILEPGSGRAELFADSCQQSGSVQADLS